MTPVRNTTLLAGMLAASAAMSQDSADVLISPEAAQRTLNKYEISVMAAEEIAAACVAWATERGGQIGIYILNPAGDVVYAYRMDGQNTVTMESALRKAQSTVDMRMSTRRIEGFPERLGPGLYELDQFPFTGGLPILLEDQLIGAVGVGGMSGAEDEECAWEALTAVVGPQPPIPEE